MATRGYFPELESIRVHDSLEKRPETKGENKHGSMISAGDLAGGQFDNRLNHRLERSREEAGGNFEAAHRLAGLEGASVFNDLDNDEIRRVNLLVACVKENADKQFVAADVITGHMQRSCFPAELVNLVAELQRQHGYPFRLESQALEDTHGWSAVGERDIGDALNDEVTIEYAQRPGEFETLHLESAQLGRTATDLAQGELNPSSVQVGEASVNPEDWNVAREAAHIAITKEQHRNALAEEAEEIAQHRAQEQECTLPQVPHSEQNNNFAPGVS